MTQKLYSLQASDYLADKLGATENATYINTLKVSDVIANQEANIKPNFIQLNSD